MNIIGVKRAREDEEEMRHSKKFKADLGLSVLQVAELIENILKFNLHNIRLILKISSLSKMHYDLIHSTAMWVRLGFSPKISKAGKLSEDALKLLLAQMRFAHLTQKQRQLDKQLQSLDRVKTKLSPDLAVDLETEEKAQFIANNNLTDDAAIALLRVIERTIFRTFTLTELVEWLERDPQLSERKEMTVKMPNILSDVDLKVQRYTYNPEKPNTTQYILYAKNEDEYVGKYVCHVKRVTLKEEKKILLFVATSFSEQRKYDKIRGHYFETESSFSIIKFDRSTSTIELCGDFDLYVAKNFGWDHPQALKHIMMELEDENLLDEVWEKLLDEVLQFMDYYTSSCPSEDELERKYTKYVAENIPLRSVKNKSV